MFIIERRAGELIQIGDEVQLCVLETDGERVRLGVSAPRDIPVRAIEAEPVGTPLADQHPEHAVRDDDTRAD